MSIRFERYKNFITPQECEKLNAWVIAGVRKKWLDAGTDRQNFRYSKRVTSRLYPDRYVYPKFVIDLSERIRGFCGISEHRLIEGHGRDGVVVSCTFNGGDVFEHQDPRSVDGLLTLRCNVLTQAADAGGVLRVGGVARPLEVGELHCYLASEHLHSVSTVSGDTPRILWMFGAHVPVEDWNSGRIKFGPA
jgi:hypothetical protein